MFLTLVSVKFEADICLAALVKKIMVSFIIISNIGVTARVLIN